jgi:hypothetical protein
MARTATRYFAFSLLLYSRSELSLIVSCELISGQLQALHGSSFLLLLVLLIAGGARCSLRGLHPSLLVMEVDFGHFLPSVY